MCGAAYRYWIFDGKLLAAFFGITPIDVPVERLGFQANQARQRPNTLVTSEHQHRWLLLGRALQAWRTSAKRSSKLRDNTALWGMLARLCDPLEETLERQFAGVMRPSLALHVVCICFLVDCCKVLHQLYRDEAINNADAAVISSACCGLHAVLCQSPCNAVGLEFVSNF